MAELFRYAAFISYSSRDAAFAQRLHRALESYTVPKSLGEFDLIGGGKKNRIYPVFRDREELSAGHLADRIEAGLKASATLIIVCSPNSAVSPWVQKEIEYFVDLGRRDRIFAIIADDAPVMDESGADCTVSCFPPAFRGNALADAAALEPLAADARKGKDEFRSAWLKIVAGLVGVTPGQLIDRDRRRRGQQRALGISGATALVLVAALAFAWTTTLAWRGPFTDQAVSSAAEGRLLLAASYAVAGNSGHALMPARTQQADIILSRLSGVRVIGSVTDRAPEVRDDSADRHLPSSPNAIWFSGDGKAVAVGDSHGQTTLFDAHGRAPPLVVRANEVRLFERGDIVTAATRPDSFEAAQTLSVIRRRDRSWDREEFGAVDDFDVSDDGRFVAVLTRPDGVRRHDMDGGAPVDFGAATSVAISPDGQALAIVRPNDQSVAFRAGVETQLGVTRGQFRFARTGGRMLTVLPDGTLRTYDLSTSGAPFDIGSYGYNLFYPPTLSPDGATLFVSDAPNNCLAFGLAEQRLLRTVAGACAFGLRGGRTLLVQSSARQYVVADLGGGAERTLGQFEHAHFISTSGMLVGERQGVLVAVALATGAERTFNAGSNWYIPPDGEHLLVQEGVDSDVIVFRMADWTERLRLPALSYRRSAMSDDGRAFVTDARDGRATLYNLENGETRDLGSIGGLRTEVNGVGRIGSIVLAPDGGAMVVGNEDGTASVFDLAVPAPNVRPNGQQRRGGDLVASVCAANAAAMPPLPTSSRAGGALAGALRGRPWNPCDWRGLLAIAPNAERGDGWFEGLSQWLRLMHVRYFGGRDWDCAETTSAASADTRARRADMCARFAPPPAEPVPR